MSKTEKFLGLGVLIAIVIAVSALIGAGSNGMKAGVVAPTDGSATNYTEITASAGYAGGALSQFQVDAVGGVTFGGSVNSTSTSNSTETLVAADFDTETYIKETPNVSSLTLTTPATSTLTAYLPIAGQCKSLTIENGTTTVGITLTLAPGTGWDFHNSTSTVANPVVGAGGIFYVYACRNTATDIEALVINALP